MALTGPPPHVFWSGREVFVAGDTTIAYDPATNRWRKAPAPDLATSPGVFHTTTLDDGRVVARVGNFGALLDVYDARTDKWTPTGPPPKQWPADDTAFVAAGNRVMIFGIASSGNIVLASQPNAAWIWEP